MLQCFQTAKIMFSRWILFASRGSWTTRVKRNHLKSSLNAWNVCLFKEHKTIFETASQTPDVGWRVLLLLGLGTTFVALLKEAAGVLLLYLFWRHFYFGSPYVKREMWFIWMQHVILEIGHCSIQLVNIFLYINNITIINIVYFKFVVDWKYSTFNPINYDVCK